MSTEDSRTPTLEEVLNKAIEYHLEDTYTSLPAKVLEYDPETQKVTVQPLVQRRVKTEDGEEFVETLPPISDVPVAFPRTRKYFITFPLERDDNVTLWVSQKSLDNWESSTGRDVVDPKDTRRHDLTDCIAYPGGYPFGAPIQDISRDTMALGRDGQGIQVHFKEDEFEVRLAGKASKHVALVEDLEALYNSLKTVFDNHTQPVVGATAGAPVVKAPAWNPGINSNVVAVPANK